MAKRVIASLAVALTLFLVLLDLSSADAGVDLPDKAGTALVALPQEYVFKSEIATTDVVLPLGNLEFLRSLPVHDHENSETKEDQNSKRDDENEAWLEVEKESVVGVVQPSDSGSGPFTVIRLGHRQHNCRHKPWFRELPHYEKEYENDESFSKDSGEDVSLDSMILRVMHLEHGHGHSNWKKYSNVPHRGGVGNIPGLRSFKRLDDQESVEENTERQEKEDESEKQDENSEKEAKKEQKEKEDEKTEAEPNDVKTETDQAKEEKAENQEKEEETGSKQTEQKEETVAKENLEKETTDKQLQIWLNRFRKFMNF